MTIRRRFAEVIGTLLVVLVSAQIANGQDNFTLVKLQNWEPRGLLESVRVHVEVDKDEVVRFLGEGGEADKEGKRWGRPAELVHVVLPTRQRTG